MQIHLHISLPSSASQVTLSLELSKLSSIIGICTHAQKHSVKGLLHDKQLDQRCMGCSLSSGATNPLRSPLDLTSTMSEQDSLTTSNSNTYKQHLQATSTSNIYDAVSHRCIEMAAYNDSLLLYSALERQDLSCTYLADHDLESISIFMNNYIITELYL